MDTIRSQWKATAEIEHEQQIAADQAELEALKKHANEIDLKLIRPLRAKIEGTETEDDKAFYAVYTSELDVIVARIRALTQLLKEETI